jgi:hypothetical protein
MKSQFHRPASAPLIIGATGGSGTRVVARLARHAGYDLGENVNASEDAMAFRSFHEKWVNRFAAAQDRHKPFSKSETARMAKDFEHALARHGGAGERWGWKTPRAIYVLPFLHAQFPRLKFIHVIRDGRDMAFSRNQNQLRKHGAAVLSLTERWSLPKPVRSILLWERVNLRAALYGEMHLRQNYLLLRFEDLCRASIQHTRRVMEFLHANVDVDEIARAEVSPPTSIGRWHEESPEMLAEMERVAAVALKKFGYLEREPRLRSLNV